MKTTLSSIIALLCFVDPLSCFAQHSTLSTTFTNPTPAAFDGFGGPMAALGTDRVVIGAIVPALRVGHRFYRLQK